MDHLSDAFLPASEAHCIFMVPFQAQPGSAHLDVAYSFIQPRWETMLIHTFLHPVRNKCIAVLGLCAACEPDAGAAGQGVQICCQLLQDGATLRFIDAAGDASRVVPLLQQQGGSATLEGAFEIVPTLAQGCECADGLLILPGWSQPWEDHGPELGGMHPPGWVFDLRDVSGPLVAQAGGRAAKG